MRILTAVLMIFNTLLVAQVPPPKHESHMHHLFASHRDSDNLAQRYEDLKCALVLIEAGNQQGTGFFISADGNVATASHVLGQRSFSKLPNGHIHVDFALPQRSLLPIASASGQRFLLVPASITTPMRGFLMLHL